MMHRVRASWPFGVFDLLSLVGLILVAYGASFLHPALPWITSGALLIVYAFLAATPPKKDQS